MRWRVIAWVSSFAVVFLFLPSLAVKMWAYVTDAPWPSKRWVFYIVIGLALFFGVRWRRRRRISNQEKKKDELSLLFLAKERLVKGEISLEEFREIRRELD
jgi:hypothetical protein